jgi:hypothetical protein
LLAYAVFSGPMLDLLCLWRKTRIDSMDGKNLSQFSKGKIKNKLSELWDQMLQQRVDQTMGAVSKRGKSQHNDQKRGASNKLPVWKTSSKSKGLFLLAFAVFSGPMLDLLCLWRMTQINSMNGKYLSQFNKAKIKNELSEPWGQMLQQRVDQTMVAVSKRGKSQHGDQKRGGSNKLPVWKTSSKSKGLFLLAYRVFCGPMLDLSCLWQTTRIKKMDGKYLSQFRGK